MCHFYHVRPILETSPNDVAVAPHLPTVVSYLGLFLRQNWIKIDSPFLHFSYVGLLEYLGIGRSCPGSVESRQDAVARMRPRAETYIFRSNSYATDLK